MARADEKLESLVDMLERSGDDAERLDIVKRAQRFKRSWIELGEGIAKLRKTRAYEKWGYRDLHEYCRMELHIQAATVDKLSMSYSTLKKHAPTVLERDGLTKEIPSIDAVEYFGKAMGMAPEGKELREPVDAPRGVVDELRAAVFDDGHTVSELRRRFNPMIHPKDPETESRELVRRTRGAARKLSELIHTVDGLPQGRVEKVETAIIGLLKDLEALSSGKAQAQPVMAKKSPSKKSQAKSQAKKPRRR